MAQNKPAEWAIKAAEAAFDHPLQTESIMQSVARAIEAADKAATERERERCFNLHKRFWQSDERGVVKGDAIINNGAIAEYALAIRKGSDNSQ